MADGTLDHVSDSGDYSRFGIPDVPRTVTTAFGKVGPSNVLYTVFLFCNPDCVRLWRGTLLNH